MGKHRIKPNYRRRVLRLPDLDHCKLAVLNKPCALGITMEAFRREGYMTAKDKWRTIYLGLVFTLFGSLAQAQTFTDLYNFTSSSGAAPYAGVIEDSSGNLCGTTHNGGSACSGLGSTVVERLSISPRS
jgi:hypothetical protein